MAARGKVSFAAAVAAVKPITKSVRVCLDGDLLAQVERLGQEFLQARLDDERLNRTDEAPAISERIAALGEQVKDAEVEFVFQSIGRLPWQDLISKHAPTKPQRELGADFNTDTFPVAAMAASCVEPEGADVAGFEALAATLNDGQWNRLWATCHAANTAGGDVPNLAAAFAPARPTEAS